MSKAHANLVASKQPDLTYRTPAEPITVTAANPKSNLKAVSTMEIPITWETGTETVLVVPGLVWPILFGENHLHATQALVDHYVPSITFRHPSMQFRVQCSLDNPLSGFESNSAKNGTVTSDSETTVPKPHVSVTCLLTEAPSPGVHKHSQSLHRGLNFVTICFTLSATLMAFQAMCHPLWIDGRDIQPGVKVLSSPFDLTQISPHVTPDTKHTDCDPFCNARLLDNPEPPDSVLTEEAPDICVTYCTTFAVESKLKKTSIAENVILGNIRDMTNEDDTLLEEAADTTAKQLEDGWLTWAESQQTPVSTQPVKNSERVEENSVLDSCAPKQWQLSVQKKEMLDAGLDASIIVSPCDALPEFDCQGPEFPPVLKLNCDPYSTDYISSLGSRWFRVFYC